MHGRSTEARDVPQPGKRGHAAIRSGGDQALSRVPAATLLSVSRLILINGAPGSGKSTVASELAARHRMMLALDVDVLKHSLGRWAEDTTESGLQARRLALAATREHLKAGYDVVLGQYLSRVEFIEALEALAVEQRAQFHEFVLTLSVRDLAARLAQRQAAPSRPEHAINNRLVVSSHAEELVASLAGILEHRTNATGVDATGSPNDTVARIESAITGN